MNPFIGLNKHKIRFAYYHISLTVSLIVLAFLFLSGISNHTWPDPILLLVSLLCASTIAPLFILGLACLEWFSKRRVRNSVFNQPPFDKLESIGFTVSYLHEHSKWFFTEETKEITMDEYTIQCDIRRETPDKVEFKAFVTHAEMGKESFTALQEKLKNNEIYFDLDGLIKIYDRKKTAHLTIHQLKSDLTGFVQLLKDEGFEPY